MTLQERFLQIGEYFAAGLYEEEDRGLFYRKALALRRYYEKVSVPEYHGEKLYPSGKMIVENAVYPFYDKGFRINKEALKQKDAELLRILEESDFCTNWTTVPSEHSVAGNMYTHSMPHFERILEEGFASYEERIRKIEDRDMREGLLHVLAGLQSYHLRCCAYLEEVCPDRQLVEALRQVPFYPARDLYEAVVGWNYILYLDNCDNLGSVSWGLKPYYRGEDIRPLLENLYDNLDCNDGYSMAVGTVENPLTVQFLEASCGKRRPMIELFVDEKTTDEVWHAALKCVLGGNGQPAFYNLKQYRDGFLTRFPKLRKEDFDKICGGGCTEMMISGMSNVGSLDAGINLLLILERSMYSRLEKAQDFESFYRGYLEDVHFETLNVMRHIANSQKLRAKYNPLPMRTLLVDDCIEKGTEFNNGGARYMWSIVSFAGIVNVIDSLLVIQSKVFEKKEYTKAEFLQLLAQSDAQFLEEAKNQNIRFGIDCDKANELSGRFTREIFGYLKEEQTYFGLGFLPASIMFRSYGQGGQNVGATPCGRKAGEALADSLSAIFNKDTQGPTAMLNSVTSMDLSRALGTPVVNLTVNNDCSPQILKSLIQAYLQQGGMQLQITCLSPEEIRAAYEHPEEHKNLIVRVGGYSEYFYRLSDDIKKKVVERTFHL